MIKNIIFDFGDIFINLDKKATENKLLKLGITSIPEQVSKLQLAYEKGLITTEKFVQLSNFYFPNATKKQLIDAWNAILLDTPKNRLTFIEELAKSKKYRLFLLSNNNDLHITWIKNNWGKNQYLKFKNSFEAFYLSHEINMRKPDNNSYEFVLNKHNLKAKETLFIDDTKENTDAANLLGINVWNLQPGKEDVVDLFTIKTSLF